MSLSKEQVIERLRRVRGPDLESNIVDLGLVSEILIKDNRVSFSITVPALRANEIYQVVLEGGVLYNVTPLVDARNGAIARIALLRGEYAPEPGTDDVLRVRFTSFRGLRGGLPEGRTFADLPALAERVVVYRPPEARPAAAW